MPVVEYAPESSGRYHRSFRLSTEDAEWKRTEERRVEAEVAGEHPEAGKQNWREYWRWTYENIRRHPGPAWKHSEFKTADDIVRWIEQHRAARGLPAYD